MKWKLRKFQLNKSPDHQTELKDKKVMLPLRNEILTNYSRYKHTVDVKLMAQKIANAIKNELLKEGVNLDVDILELMCDWHDVGHCPFGHAGEMQLNSLLSENDMWYVDSFFSGYKHNLLSAKILLDEHPTVPWNIIDGIIKHTEVLPKNFNVTRVQNDNILKLNYIFRPRYNKSGPHKTSWEEFITQGFSSFPCYKCSPHNKPIKECQSLNSHIELCRNSFGKYCCSDNSSEDKCGENITKYLLYPHNLTFEGESLRLADEITALTNDLFYYFQYVHKYYNDKSKSHIVQNQLINVIYQLNVIYPNHSKLYDCISKIIKGNSDTKDENFDYIQNFFISKIVVNNFSSFGSPIDNILAYVSIDQNETCQPLLRFEAEADSIFTTLKKSIYHLIHQDRLIFEDNRQGTDALKKIFNYYYEHVEEFFKVVKESDEIQKQLNEITDQIKKFPKLSVVDKIKEAKTQGIPDGDKLLNAYRREVIFYIASKTEKWILDFSQVI